MSDSKERELLELVKDMAYVGCDSLDINRALDEAIDKSDIAQRDAKETASRQIDEFVVRYQLAIQAKERVLQKMIIGGIIFSLGVLAAIASYVVSDGQSVILSFIALLVGGWMLKEGYKKYR